MSPNEIKTYFDILEIPPNANLMEVRKAYHTLKDLYSKDSIVTLPLDNEFSEEHKEEILRRIEEAYRNLVAFFDKDREPPMKKKAPEGANEAAIEEPALGGSFSGTDLKRIRENLRIDLHDVSLATKIHVRYLENIESERFEDLPPEVYTRGFVVSYAKYLSLDPQKVAGDFMTRYREWKKAEREGATP